jgi:hypothetical protein
MPEVHIYDRDVPAYADSVAQVNSRTDGSWAVLTVKHEMECYLHPDAIRDEFNFTINIVDHPDAANPTVPKAFGVAFAAHKGWPQPMKDESKCKKHLLKAFRRMTAERIRERDPNGEVEGWLRRIAEQL